MVTSGQPTQQALRHGKVSIRPHPVLSGKLVKMAVCALAVLLMGACATSLRVGKEPATDRLSELTWNVSTGKDVVAILGEPEGRGATRSPSFGLKEGWFYYYSVTDGARVRTHMLMVFLDKDTHVYQGHMWVASGMLIAPTH